MNKKEQERLQKEIEPFLSEITELAKEIAKDYKKTKTVASGSSVFVSENSPYLDEQYDEKGWKRVLKVNKQTHIKKIKKNKKKYVREYSFMCIFY